MNLLQDILYKVGIRSVHGDLHIPVMDLQIDSRKVTKGCLFIAVRGNNIDGHEFIDSAIEKGATAVICELLPLQINNEITYVQVENSASATGFVAHNFYDQPSEKLKLVGVTGTNGKTTIATLLYKLFTVLGYKSGLLSTVQNQIGTGSWLQHIQHRTQSA